jgi:23S rRNA (cytosine1962-C5)-methyltransferase
MYPTIVISSKRTASLHFQHPWIFSGAIVGMDSGVEHGGLVRVVDEDDVVYGVGTYSSRSSIAVRVFDWKEVVIEKKWFVARLREAMDRRKLMGFGKKDTTGYRVLFGEADGVPGLVVDRYGDVAVFQIATAGLDNLREEIVAAIKNALDPRVIVERSDIGVRKDDGLVDVVAVRFGEVKGCAPFLERGRAYVADALGGQKTGFFLDQRDARDAVAGLSKGRECLNLFSYSGAFGVAAMLGGAKSVHNVDLSAPALELCGEHARLNQIGESVFTTEEADVFQWLNEHDKPSYDLVVLDPPALIKSSKDAEAGKKAYHFLNRAGMRLVRDGGVFVTSSCSAHLSEEDMVFALRRASVQAGVRLSILQTLHQSSDHPTSIYFPESLYLKTFVSQIGVRS